MSNDKTIKLLNSDLQNKQDNITKAIEPEWITKHWLAKGNVTALFGYEEYKKALFMQQLATSLSTGKAFLGKKSEPLNVLFLAPSDQSYHLFRKQLEINSYYNLKMIDLYNKLKFVFYEKTKDLFVKFNDNPRHTDYFYHLLCEIMTHKPDLVVIDNIQNFFSGDKYNPYQVVYFIDSTFKYIANIIGCSVLISSYSVMPPKIRTTS